VVPAVIVFVGAVGFVALRLVIAAHGHINRFVMASPPWSNAAKIPPSLKVIPVGYDGQFYYRLALDPFNFHRTAFGITLDAPFRLERIGYPALSWLVSFGRVGWVPVSLLIVNLAAVTGLGFIGGSFARSSGRHALWGLLLAVYFGYVFSLGRDLTEPVAAFMLLAGLLALRKDRPLLAAAFLAYAAISRETVMVAVGAIAVVRIVEIARRQKRFGREDAAWLVPAAAFAGWQLIVRSVIGVFPISSDLKDNSGTPFVALVKAIKNNLQAISPHHAAVDEWIIELAVLAVFVIAAAVSLHTSSIPMREKVAFVFYALGLLTLSSYVWDEHGDLRTLNEVYMFSVLVLLGSKRRLWPFAVLAVVVVAIVGAHRIVAL